MSADVIYPDTRVSLVQKAAAGDRESLGQLVELYTRPLTQRLARRTDPETAEMLVTSFMEDKFFFEVFDKDLREEKQHRWEQRLAQKTNDAELESDRSSHAISILERWDKSRGMFRNYVVRALEFYAKNHFAKQYRFDQRHLSGADADVTIQDMSGELERLSQIEEILQLAIKRTVRELQHRPPAWNVFVARMLEPAIENHDKPRTWKQVGVICGQSEGAVTGIGTRIKKRFNRHLDTVIAKNVSIDERDEIRAEIRSPEVHKQLSLGDMADLLNDTDDD